MILIEKLSELSALLKNYRNDESEQNEDAVYSWFDDNREFFSDLSSKETLSVSDPIGDLCRLCICSLVDESVEEIFTYAPDEMLDYVIDEIASFIENDGKDISQRRFTFDEKVFIVDRYQDDRNLNIASDTEISFYRKFAQELCDAEELSGLLAVGYGTYGGNRAFPCDFEISRKCMHKLIEKYPDYHNVIFYANTLGYIYYYGRTNDGVPQYDEAFKYFSIAAHGGVYEAKYKIADMFRNGYGTIKNSRIAENIIYDLYSKNFKDFLDGDFDCKLADLALRMGSIAEDYDDPDEALLYYMQAEYAIRMRMQSSDYYGDSKVAASINEALTSVKQKIDFIPSTKIRFEDISELIGRNMKYGNKMDVTVKKTSDYNYKFTFSMHKGKFDKYAKRMFVCIPDIEMVGFYDKVTVTCNESSPLPEGKFLIDDVYSDALCYDGEPVILFSGDHLFSIKNPDSSNAKTFRFVSVRFNDYNIYDYLCDDESVKVGDFVIVNTRDEDVTVPVVNTFTKKECELSLPLKRYKHITSKLPD